LQLRLELHPHDVDAHKKLIELLRTRNAFRAIVTEDTTWLNNNRSDSWALIELVSTSESALDDPEYAIAQLRVQMAAVARQDDPEDYDSWADQLAERLQKRGRPQEALPLLSELVRLNPKEAGFWDHYGRVLSLLGERDQAAMAFRRSIDLEPSIEGFHADFAEDLLRSGDLGEAETEYRAWLSIYDAQYKTGEPTDSPHSMIKSVVKSEAARGEESLLAECRMKLAHVLLLEKKYDDALREAKAALAADRYEFSAFYLEAELHDAKGDHDQASKVRTAAAAAIHEEVIEEDAKWPRNRNKPDMDPRVLFLLDTLWNGESGYPAFPSEIISLLAPRINSLTASERVALATAYFAIGRVSNGKEQWERAIASASELDTAVGQHNLAEELVKGRAFDDALPHLRRAYELDPQNTTFRMDFQNELRFVKTSGSGN